MIVTQYYQSGSMFELLKKARRGDRRAMAELAWSKRLDMLRDVAAGMVFLHSRRPAVVHGDLRSPNLLLDMAFDRDKPRLHVKIADFGLACMLGPAKTLAVSKVTNPRWSAPEVIRDSSVSTSADVFSFGIVMWELLTWAQPYEEMMSVQVLFSVMQNLRPEMPDDADLPGRPGPSLPGYKELMAACWQEDAEARPSFEAILERIDALRTADRAARVAERAAAGDAAASSRRTSYSGESAPPSPLASPDPHSAFGSGRSAETDDAAAAAATWRGGAADSATSMEDPSAAAAAALLAAGRAGPRGSGGQRSSPGAAMAAREVGPASAQPSPQSSPGAFGASEPSFAAFASGAGSFGGGPVGSSNFGFGAAAGGDAPTPQMQYATAEALRSPSRAPSRLGRGSTSASGALAGLPPILTGTPGGFGASMHSPRAAPPRPASPFAQSEQQQQPPPSPGGASSPFALQEAQLAPPAERAGGASSPGRLEQDEGQHRQRQQSLPEQQQRQRRPASPFGQVQSSSPFSQAQAASPFSQAQAASPFSQAQAASPFSQVQAASPFSQAQPPNPLSSAGSGGGANQQPATAQEQHASQAQSARGTQPAEEPARPASPFAAVQARRPASPFAAAQASELEAGEPGPGGVDAAGNLGGACAGGSGVGGGGGGGDRSSGAGSQGRGRPASPFAAANLGALNAPGGAVSGAPAASTQPGTPALRGPGAAGPAPVVSAASSSSVWLPPRSSSPASPGRLPGQGARAAAPPSASAGARATPADGEGVGSFMFFADTPSLARLRQEQAQMLPASDSLTFPTAGKLPNAAP
ncbi:MAG: hypothetical protein J3K34DRAFT_373955 [Monoraphidium minutum]|nr:MAG: hypothetical protein J3K34DRAFT_373955 [Monoraphidium minutum]